MRLTFKELKAKFREIGIESRPIGDELIEWLAAEGWTQGEILEAGIKLSNATDAKERATNRRFRAEKRKLKAEKYKQRK